MLDPREEIRLEKPHWGVSPCLQLHPEFSYGVQPLLPHVKEATLPPSCCYFGIGATLSHGTYHFKFVQKLKECVKWAHKKAESCQVKETQHHKPNYEKWSKAAALEVWDTVLVCVTAFKGCHKIQNWWENREYMVERWPYPYVPVYVVCPRDGEGHSQILHRNYLLPISSNLEHTKKVAPMEGVEHTSTSAPVPSVGNEPADTELSRMATLATTGNTSQGSLDQPAPLRHNTCTTWNQLPWRYCNFALLADTSLPSILDVWLVCEFVSI